MHVRTKKQVRLLSLTMACAIGMTGCAALQDKIGIGGNENGNGNVDVPREDPKIDGSVEELLKRATITTAITKEGIFLIDSELNILDPAELPEAPRKIGEGEVVNFDSVAIFATTGSPIEIRIDTGFQKICIVKDDETGETLGPCPKELYER